MKRVFAYAGVALLTFLVGAGVYLASPGLNGGHVRRRQLAPFAAREANGGARCLDDTLYVWEKVEDIETGVVDPTCASVQMGLLNAAKAGDVDWSRRALAQGANPNAPGFSAPGSYHENKRPLVQAAAAGHTQVIELLLDNGADVNEEYCCCMSCTTPLDAAVGGGHVGAVKLLLERGANAEHKERYSGLTILQGAEKQGNSEIIQLLRRAGG